VQEIVVGGIVQLLAMVMLFGHRRTVFEFGATVQLLTTVFPLGQSVTSAAKTPDGIIKATAKSARIYILFIYSYY
jgi:hypothetical protein